MQKKGEGFYSEMTRLNWHLWKSKWSPQSMSVKWYPDLAEDITKMAGWAEHLIEINNIDLNLENIGSVDMQFFNHKNQAAADEYYKRSCLHHDGCEKLIIVYVTLINHTEGSQIATISPLRTKKGDVVQDPDQHYTLRGPVEGSGVLIDDFQMYHGSPNIKAIDEDEWIQRVMFRIKGNSGASRSRRDYDPRQYHAQGAGMDVSIMDLLCAVCNQQRCTCTGSRVGRDS